VDNEKKQVDSNMIFRVFLCLFLGLVLFLFIRNNDLFAHGGHNLRNPEALIMLAILGIPFLLSLFHLIRGVRHHQYTND
jgi:succinate dehydrogenase/fumarate reductase cytochrome b subunit